MTSPSGPSGTTELHPNPAWGKAWEQTLHGVGTKVANLRYQKGDELWEHCKRQVPSEQWVRIRFDPTRSKLFRAVYGRFYGVGSAPRGLFVAPRSSDS
jgi:hypothetical protein